MLLFETPRVHFPALTLAGSEPPVTSSRDPTLSPGLCGNPFTHDTHAHTRTHMHRHAQMKHKIIQLKRRDQVEAK